MTALPSDPSLAAKEEDFVVNLQKLSLPSERVFLMTFL
jgi:hypothetical protein